MSVPGKAHLLFIGDSLTEFFDWRERFPGYEVTNLGIAGETVEGLAGRMDAVCRSVGNPDVIFLMTGINNIAMGQYDILPVYRKILTVITSCFGNAVVTVQSILPVGLPWTDNDKIKQINHSLRILAEELHVRYLDLHSLSAEPDGSPVVEYLLQDGVHLSDKGYWKWSEAVERFLESSTKEG